MGQEISETHFRHDAFRHFQQRLDEQTLLVTQWIRDGHFSNADSMAGLELELCLVDASGQPAACNHRLLEAVHLPSVVPELSQFNIEFNVDPASPQHDGIELLSQRLGKTWADCRFEAERLGVGVLSIGILPTLRDDHLTLQNVSSLYRYRALNEQVLRLRRGRPAHLDISGIENLTCEHSDVMLEAGTTSLQLHLQVPQARAADAYNMATVISAPMVAVSGNSPLLFGKLLWQETRIALFEQAVAAEGPLNRVTLGTGYAQDNLAFLFEENRNLFPVLLPLESPLATDKLPELRLHNGTIWRWNRPIIGFDGDGTPHLRIEHRVMGAGPSLIDMTAQMALFYGLMTDFLTNPTPAIDRRLPFISAWNNFYDAARMGLKAHVLWLDGKRWPMTKLILDVLLPAAQNGLESLKVPSDSITRWLQIIAERTMSGQTGSKWQSEFFSRYGRDCAALVREYRWRQEAGEPVHQWSY